MKKIESIFSRNSHFINGELVVAGVSVTGLVKEFGTPLFIADEDDFRWRATQWRDGLKRAFGESAGDVYYAGKAFLCVEVARWIEESGIGLDVCTGGELAVGLAAKFPPERIEMHGNNKSEAEIALGIDCNVGRIVVDSLQELERVSRIATSKKKVQKILLRLTPGIEAHTHEFIATAHEDVKFGFSITSGAAWEATLLAQSLSGVSLQGFHAHIGSQIFSPAGFESSAQCLIEMLAQYRDKFDIQLPELDLGGGYGISYLEDDRPLTPDEILSHLAEIVKKSCAQRSLEIPKISIEPGRAIVGPSMCTVYEVGTTKEVSLDNGGTRWYISVDGGMSDNIRPALYNAQYSVALANRQSHAATRSSRVVGKHCESGDILIYESQLPSDIAPGDLLVIPATGAYGRSMASNYNQMARPPVVAVINATARTILRRETASDLLALDVVEKAREIPTVMEVRK